MSIHGVSSGLPLGDDDYGFFEHHDDGGSVDRVAQGAFAGMPELLEDDGLGLGGLGHEAVPMGDDDDDGGGGAPIFVGRGRADSTDSMSTTDSTETEDTVEDQGLLRRGAHERLAQVSGQLFDALENQSTTHVSPARGEDGAPVGRFDKARTNGMEVVGKSAANVRGVQAKLAALMCDEFKEALTADNNDKIGFSIDLATGRLVLLRKQDGDSDICERLEFNLNDETSLQEFILLVGKTDDEGNPSLTLNELKQFIADVQSSYPQSLQSPTRSLGNVSLSSGGISSSFSNHAQNAVGIAIGAGQDVYDAPGLQGYQHAVIAQHSKTTFLESYHKAVLLIPNVGQSARNDAERELALLEEVNRKKSLEMAFFLKHSIKTETTGEELTVKDVISQAIEGGERANLVEPLVMFASLIDYAQNIASQDTSLNADQKKEKVSSLANLFINIVHTGIEKKIHNGGYGNPGVNHVMRGMVQKMRLMQNNLIDSGALVSLSYNSEVSALEAKLAFSSYEDIESEITEANVVDPDALHPEQLVDQQTFNDLRITGAKRQRMAAGDAAVPNQSAAVAAARGLGARVHRTRGNSAAAAADHLASQKDAVVPRAVHGMNLRNLAQGVAPVKSVASKYLSTRAAVAERRDARIAAQAEARSAREVFASEEARLAEGLARF
ncbi:hypothetical protein COB21_03015 [Candidatus Aerophobetes bacterium]|uniref:Uncharacterized protein n=1 Tax=Aerophobetes bacterium TaxID=2030807 RepID=A0A2A4X4D5_UNCAE|nr:MAG: hypothetical protein COB21_03015 [Candidatus Aerophobetes bacterium]